MTGPKHRVRHTNGLVRLRGQVTRGNVMKDFEKQALILAAHFSPLEVSEEIADCFNFAQKKAGPDWPGEFNREASETS